MVSTIDSPQGLNIVERPATAAATAATQMVPSVSTRSWYSDR
jgi:hypothetical protein